MPETWGDIDRRNFRRNVHHEAAHAAVAWLIGRAADIDHIDMRGNDLASTSAHVQIYARNRLQHPRRWIAFDLAGYAAEDKLDPQPDWWFDAQWKEANASDPSHDIGAAYRLAMFETQTPGRAYLLLKRAARWTDELLAIPRVWRLVTSLASAMEYGTVMNRAAITQTLAAAWGLSDARLPLCELGYNWRRRMRVSDEERFL